MIPACDGQHRAHALVVRIAAPGSIESEISREGNLEASVRSRDTDDAMRSERDVIEAGLN